LSALAGVGLLPDVLEQVFASRTVLDDGGEPRPLGGNVSREEALALYDVVRVLKPDVSVEVGFAYGISATAILKALADNDCGEHHVIDPNQSSYGNCGLALARRGGVEPRLVFHESYAEDVIPVLPAIQFAFIDSSHLFDLTISEFVLVDKKLSVGGVIGFHDLWMPSLRKVLRYILSNRAYRVFHQPAPAAPSGSLRSAAQMAAGSVLRRLPSSARHLFREEIVVPWQTLGLGHLAFIQKLDDDRREWTHHRDF
jgi:predicted O-methyltransferase YrrM